LWLEKKREDECFRRWTTCLIKVESKSAAVCGTYNLYFRVNYLIEITLTSLPWIVYTHLTAVWWLLIDSIDDKSLIISSFIDVVCRYVWNHQCTSRISLNFIDLKETHVQDDHYYCICVYVTFENTNSGLPRITRTMHTDCVWHTPALVVSQCVGFRYCHPISQGRVFFLCYFCLLGLVRLHLRFEYIYICIVVNFISNSYKIVFFICTGSNRKA